ncbi:MAG: hypothetical protein NC483_03515 [Ruminococcus sp.]|nr:hypothetical protein [Ruminococcus sp.]
MKINDVLTLDNDVEYLILDMTELSKDTYLYCVGLDKDDLPTKEFIFLKKIEIDNELSVEKVTDEKLIEALTSLFTTKFISENIDEEQDA